MSRSYIRKPSISKRVSARTTGKATRALKRAVNPTYGKNGMGWINDPQKALYNKVYNKTSKSVDNLFNSSSSSNNSNSQIKYSSNTDTKKCPVWLIILNIILWSMVFFIKFCV